MSVSWCVCRLVGLLHPIDCKVNLIVFNTHEGTRFKPSTPEAVQLFRSIVIQVPLQTPSCRLVRQCPYMHAALTATVMRLLAGWPGVHSQRQPR